MILTGSDLSTVNKICASACNSVQQFHVDCPGITSSPVVWETSFWLPESWHSLVIVSQKLQTLGERIIWFHLGHPHIKAIGIFETWAVYAAACAALCILMHHKWLMYSSVNIVWYTYDFLPFMQGHSIRTDLWLGMSILCSWSVLFLVLLMKLIGGGRRQSLRSVSDVLLHYWTSVLQL